MIMFNVLKKFNLRDEIKLIDSRGKGPVNRTFLAYGEKDRYVMQMIDKNVFKNHKKVMENVETVTNYLQIEKESHDIQILRSRKGRIHVKVKGTYWRCYKLRENEKVVKTYHEEMGRGFGEMLGRFHRLTNDFPVESLYETIPNFQNTNKYFQKYLRVLKETRSDKTLYIFDENKFLLDRKSDFNLINNLLKDKLIPLKVTHNATRKSNVVFEAETYKPLYMIGFAAIMPGSRLHDFGEMARYAFSDSKENETNLEKINFNFERMLNGIRAYLTEVKDIITDTEVEYLIQAIRICALEYGIKQLTDYLLDGRSFNLKYYNDNLIIARNQFKLVKDIEDNYEVMQNKVITLFKEIKTL